MASGCCFTISLFRFYVDPDGFFCRVFFKIEIGFSGRGSFNREMGGWLFYCGLLYTSPLWIEVMSRVMLGVMIFPYA